jgi:hypothetical protein
VFSFVTVRCPKCQATFRAEAAQADKLIRCAACGGNLKVAAGAFRPDLANPVNAACAELVDRVSDLIPKEARADAFYRLRSTVEVLMIECEVKGRNGAALSVPVSEN